MSPRGMPKKSNPNDFNRLDASLLLGHPVFDSKQHLGLDNKAFVLSPVGGDATEVSCQSFLSDTTSTGHPAPTIATCNKSFTHETCSISMRNNRLCRSPETQSIGKGRLDDKGNFNLNLCPKNEDDCSNPFVDLKTPSYETEEELVSLKPQFIDEQNVQIYRLEVPSKSHEMIDKENNESFIEYHLTKKIIRGKSSEENNLPVTESCHLPIKLQVTYDNSCAKNDTYDDKIDLASNIMDRDPLIYYSPPCELNKRKNEWTTQFCDVTTTVNRKPPQEIWLSKGETMVKLGGGEASLPPSLPHNVKVSTTSNTSLNNVNKKENRVSQVSVNSSNSAGVNPSGSTFNNGVPSHPVVSALSKVSSVRIVPSPISTPTPSVIGGDNPSSQGSHPQASLNNTNRNTNHIQPTVIASVENQGRTVDQEVPIRPITNSNPTDRPSAAETEDNPRRGNRERRRERRERRRERRAYRSPPAVPQAPRRLNTHSGQTQIPDLPQTSPQSPSHLPDLLNSHVPPPYSTLPNGSRNMAGIIPPPPIHMHLPPPGGPIPPPFQPPSPLRHRPNSWPIFSSRRSRGGMPYLTDEEAKSCCGLLVTQAVSIRWFIIMIAFVGLCCTVVGTVLGILKTNNSEYVTITLLMIGVGIVLITVSGVAWHLTSRDAPCRVMLGLASGGRSDTRRFMARMPPPFGRPQHPYAAMLYPEFQFRPPPPSYQASMQEYRLRLLLLDRQNVHPVPPHTNLAAPPPNYRIGPLRPPPGTISHESDTSRPPSYRSRDGSIHQVSTNPSVANGTNGTLRSVSVPSHSHSPSCLSFLSHESLYSNTSRSDRHNNDSGKVVDAKFAPLQGLEAPSTSKKVVDVDDNRVTIVQSTDSSQVFGNQSVVVTVSGSSHMSSRPLSDPEMAVLAHL